MPFSVDCSGLGEGEGEGEGHGQGQGQDMPGQARPGQARTGQARPGEDRDGAAQNDLGKVGRFGMEGGFHPGQRRSSPQKASRLHDSTCSMSHVHMLHVTACMPYMLRLLRFVCS